MDPGRDRIAAAFERELERAPLPHGLRAQAVHYALHARGADEPARRAGPLALVAALLAIAIVATLLLVGHERQAAPANPGPHRTSPYTIPSPPSVASGCSSTPRQWASYPPNPAKMLSTTTGWAYGPMRTTDGGASWTDVSPPSIANRTNKNDEFFLDATHAWVAETASSANACVDHVVIFRTVDEGRTWQQSAPIPVRFSVPTDVLWTGVTNHAGLLSFVDAQNGWLLLGSGPTRFSAADGVDQQWNGANWRVGDLYRTTDGGLHWTLAATDPGSASGCVPGPQRAAGLAVMSFSSVTTGWISGDCVKAGGWRLLVTHDGGVTWGVQVLPISAPSPTCSIPCTGLDVPVFFDERQGMILVEGRLLATSDGGASWSVRSMPTGAFWVDFITPSEGWAAGAGANPSPVQCSLQNLDACNGNFQLYRTGDGGQTWVPGSSSSFLEPAPKYWPPAYLHFVDSKTGFLDPGGPIHGLFRTNDGGRTWTAVQGTVQGP
jgi:photosystem II stability/assembly factor-like uncharacterized protein